MKKASKISKRGAGNNVAKEPLPGRQELSVQVAPWGPDPAVVRPASSALLQHPLVRKQLGKARHKLVDFRLIEPEAEAKTSRVPPPPSRYRASIYDYTNNRTLIVEGALNRPKVVQVSESASQPRPSPEEFDEAVKILMKEPEIGPAIRDKRLRAYPPMPPLVNTELPDGRVERTIAVGLLPDAAAARALGAPPARHEIAAVNLIHKSVQRFASCAPPMAEAHNPICGLPYAGQATASGVPGQVWVTVTQGATVLWKFLVVRPAASSGTNGSGVELRYVDYRGKRLLYRAHVPILNVKYDPGGCGPYRDWQNQESMIQANGADVAPGFRLCNAPAQTIIDSGSDLGNYLGVAIYVQGLDVVLVSEMEAGWYRYISQWRLHADGTIRPRFGFSSVSSSCVCTTHHHHVYWRLDFDIRTPGNNLVREFNDPCLPGFCPSNWHNKTFEIRRPRDPGRHRKWRVENTVSGEAYDIIPGPDDGVATASPDWPFPQGDVWILRYHGSEIDDGVVATGPPYEAGLNTWVNGEPIANQDVVIWYAGHVTHDVTHDPPGVFGHVVGPDLHPVKW